MVMVFAVGALVIVSQNFAGLDFSCLAMVVASVSQSVSLSVHWR